METKEDIYNKICRTLTDYEQTDKPKHNMATWADTFYSLLVDIQNGWEYPITAQDE